MNHKPYKILVAVGCYPPDHGGSGLRIHRTYKNLLEHGFPANITVLTMAGRREPAGIQKFEGIKVIRVSEKNGLSPLKSLWKVARLLCSKKNSFDLIHGVGNTPPLVVAACLWARWLSIPHIRERTGTGITSALKHSLKGYLLRLTYTKSDLAMASKDIFNEEFQKIGVPEHKIWIRPHPINTEKFYFRKECKKKYFPEASKTHLVLGRIRPNKNQFFGVKVLQELPDNHNLLLVGPLFDEQKEYFDRIRNYISKHNLSKRVQTIPELHPHPEKLYHTADTCWIPSIHEGLPNVMLEALACGLPVMANEELGLQEYLRKNEGGFTAPLQPEKFAEKIQNVCNNPKDYPSREQLSQIMQERFDIDKINKTFREKLMSILSST